MQELESAKEWVGCSSMGRVARRRMTQEKRSYKFYVYITSLDLDVEKFAKSARTHWRLEDGLDMAVDVVFNEDTHRDQEKIGAATSSP